MTGSQFLLMCNFFIILSLWLRSTLMIWTSMYSNHITCVECGRSSTMIIEEIRLTLNWILYFFFLVAQLKAWCSFFFFLMVFEFGSSFHEILDGPKMNIMDYGTMSIWTTKNWQLLFEFSLWIKSISRILKYDFFFFLKKRGVGNKNLRIW